jgi:hypothetical protein
MNNGRADAFSRRADYREKPEAMPYSILRECSDNTLEYNHQI